MNSEPKQELKKKRSRIKFKPINQSPLMVLISTYDAWESHESRRIEGVFTSIYGGLNYLSDETLMDCVEGQIVISGEMMYVNKPGDTIKAFDTTEDEHRVTCAKILLKRKIEIDGDLLDELGLCDQP